MPCENSHGLRDCALYISDVTIFSTSDAITLSSSSAVSSEIRATRTKISEMATEEYERSAIGKKRLAAGEAASPAALASGTWVPGAICSTGTAIPAEVTM